MANYRFSIYISYDEGVNFVNNIADFTTLNFAHVTLVMFIFVKYIDICLTLKKGLVTCSGSMFGMAEFCSKMAK